MQFLPLIGRIFYSLMFILASFGHFTKGLVAYAAGQGVPMPEVLVPLSGVMALLGGLSILLGFKARLGAVLIILFLIPVTLMIHNFWAVTDPSAATIQKLFFLKNLSMLGGAFLIAYFGSGPYSLSCDQCPKDMK